MCSLICFVQIGISFNQLVMSFAVVCVGRPQTKFFPVLPLLLFPPISCNFDAKYYVSTDNEGALMKCNNLNVIGTIIRVCTHFEGENPLETFERMIDGDKGNLKRYNFVLIFKMPLHYTFSNAYSTTTTNSLTEPLTKQNSVWITNIKSKMVNDSKR